jgi:sugar phosphate isomerase/epimerase
MEKNFINRRDFIQRAAAATLGLGVAGLLKPSFVRAAHHEKQLFHISLAQWSLHRAFRAKELDPLDFAKIAKEEFDIHAIEYVNQFYTGKATDTCYLKELKKRADDYGVKSLLIMCDGEGRLGDPDAAARTQAVENHYKWVEAAKFLGCHSIRVNAGSSGSYEEQMKLAADGLQRLSDFADQYGLNVIVENHGGLSSNGEWLAGTLRMANRFNCGALPDFGNFRVSGDEWYDRYKGVAELMPYAKAVSAKAHDFNDLGNESHTDYYRMMDIVVEAGYRGFVGIEYEGSSLGEYEGIKATKALMEKVRDVLS